MAIKTPRSQREIESKLRKVQLQLEQFQEFKKILRESGMKPDEDDRLKESRLIQRALGFEKDLKRMAKGTVEIAPVPQKFSRAKVRASKHD